MKPITHEWFTRATDDLATAQVLLSHEHLTNMVAFHAQQGVEKALKAVYIESRYPGDLGLLPAGKPTLEEATDLFDFATDVFRQLQANLQNVEATSRAEQGQE